MCIRDSQNTAQKRERKAEQKKELYTIIAGAVLFLGTVLVNEVMGYEDYSFPFFLAFAVSYLILGGEVLLSAGKNILKGQMFDENFLMSIAILIRKFSSNIWPFKIFLPALKRTSPPKIR